MGLLEIYLIGVLLTGGYYNYNECHPTPRIMTSGECATLSGVAGVLWPVIPVTYIYEKVKE